MKARLRWDVTRREFGASINVMGRITDGPVTGLLEGPPLHWAEELTNFITELGFDTFVFWPNEDPIRQVERFTAEVVPGVREHVARARR